VHGCSLRVKKTFARAKGGKQHGGCAGPRAEYQTEHAKSVVLCYADSMQISFCCEWDSRWEETRTRTCRRSKEVNTMVSLYPYYSYKKKYLKEHFGKKSRILPNLSTISHGSVRTVMKCSARTLG
jgi:hypothetical protein